MQHYAFGDFVIDVDQRRLLRRSGEVLVLTPRPFEALLFLVQHPGELLDKETLMEALWPGLVVEENSLSQTISGLRRVLGDEAHDSRYILTVPRRGFRFIATVTPLAPVQPSIVGREAPGPSSELLSVPTPAPAGRRRVLFGALLAGSGVLATSATAWWWRSRDVLRVGGSPTTLAVLPFKPLAVAGGDADLELGMADSLIARLSALPGVAVRSIGSVRRYAGADQDPLRAARELKVAWIVDGSIQRSGDQVRVSARLLQAADGEAAWSGSFDERFTSVFDLQDAISSRVSQVLSPHLGADGRKQLAGAGGTRNIDAYQTYLAARQQAQGIRTAGLLRSIALYQKAIALDPGYALAHVGLAESNRRMIFGADGEPRTIFQATKRHVREALDLVPGLADALTNQAWNRFWSDWDWAGAEKTFLAAIAANPNEVNAHFGYSQLLEALGRRAETGVQLRIARELDPSSPLLLTMESAALYSSGTRDEAWQRLQRVFDLEPDFWIAHLFAGIFHSAEGQPDLAIESMERAARLADGSSQPASALGFLLARTGHTERARQIADELRDAGRSRFVPPLTYGVIYAGLGDTAAALAALEQAYLVRDVRMTLMNSDGRWARLKDEPRYVAIFRQMNFAT